MGRMGFERSVVTGGYRMLSSGTGQRRNIFWAQEPMTASIKLLLP